MNVDLARIQFASTTIYHFLFVPITIGLAFLVAILQTMWHRSRQPGPPPAGAVLRHAARDQRRDRRRDRARAGVRVRYELVGLLPLRRRRVRRPAGDGGPRRVLPGVDVPRTLAVRLGPAAASASTSRASGLVAVGAILSAAFIMAANSWMQHPVGYAINPDDRSTRAQRHRRGVHQPGVRLGLHATCSWRRSSPAALLMLAVSAWHLRRRSSGRRRSCRTAKLALVVLVPAIFLTMTGGQPARRHRDQVPADEDRRGRGAVGDLPAVLVLGVPDRRRQQRPDADEDHRDPPPALGAGHRHLERAGGRAQRAAGAVRGSSTARGTTSRTSSSSTGRCG